MEAVQVTTSDDQVLSGDLVAVDEAVAGVVLCHPHPQYGGSRHDHVVSALFEALPTHGASVLRFDFRRAYGGGVAERLDASAAVQLLGDRIGDRPLHLVGYSFGAMVTLACEAATIASRVAIAPPLSMDPAVAGSGPASGPTLVIAPEHDQFCSPADAEAAIARWPDTTLATVPMADHFLAGRTAAVADLVTTWVRDHSTPEHPAS